MSPLGQKVSACGGGKPPSTLYFRVVHPPLVTRRTRSTHFEGPSQNFSNPPTPASQAQLPLTAVVEFCSVSRQCIISRSDDCTIRIWDAETGAPVGDPLEGHTDLVLSIAYSPDGRYIISGSDDGTIRIWAAETGALVGSPIKRNT